MHDRKHGSYIYMPLAARGDDAPAAAAQPWQPLLLGAQYNAIHQHLDSFTSPYSGPLSLPAAGGDGQTETFEFTEVDRALSLGGQLAGTHWGQPEDRLGVAVVINGIAAVHQRYLELGGCGFGLCDGRLDYGHESVMEAYYRWRAGKHAQISQDVQFIENPGYNRDRGPVRIYGLRLHLEY